MPDFRHLVSFRVDASLQMGTGHVMRCLTLADSLKLRGATCVFLCRDLPGNLVPEIRQRGHRTHVLPRGTSLRDGRAGDPAHLSWLEAELSEDIEQTATLLSQLQPAFLIVDHYALDRRWEAAMRPFCTRVFAIDDLADRPHDCDLLLDQNLGRQPGDYQSLVSDRCTLMIGPRYALLRPEFAEVREHSLERRKTGLLRHVLIAMGGVDSPNATQAVLEVLQRSTLPRESHLSVVLGPHAPWLPQVREMAARMRIETRIHAAPPSIAHLMAQSDLAIGAAGGTAWERCCLGVPTLVAVLAANQRLGAQALADSGAAVLLGESAAIPRTLPSALAAAARPEFLLQMSRKASDIVDGRGVEHVVQALGAALD